MIPPCVDGCQIAKTGVTVRVSQKDEGAHKIARTLNPISVDGEEGLCANYACRYGFPLHETFPDRQGPRAKVLECLERWWAVRDLNPGNIPGYAAMIVVNETMVTQHQTWLLPSP